MVNINDLQDSYNRISKYLVTTPILQSENLNKEFNADIYLKNEVEQLTGSFKIRGALSALSKLKEDGIEGARGEKTMPARNQSLVGGAMRVELDDEGQTGDDKRPTTHNVQRALTLLVDNTRYREHLKAMRRVGDGEGNTQLKEIVCAGNSHEWLW